MKCPSKTVKHWFCYRRKTLKNTGNNGLALKTEESPEVKQDEMNQTSKEISSMSLPVLKKEEGSSDLMGKPLYNTDLFNRLFNIDFSNNPEAWFQYACSANWQLASLFYLGNRNAPII